MNDKVTHVPFSGGPYMVVTLEKWVELLDEAKAEERSRIIEILKQSNCKECNIIDSI